MPNPLSCARAFVLVVLMLAGCITQSPTPSVAPASQFPTPTAGRLPVGVWRLTAPAPISARLEHTAVWTGREMLIWGGETFPVDRPEEDAGAAYNPMADDWRLLPDAPVQRRWAHLATFTGHEMLIWGGIGARNVQFDDGAAYDADTHSWRRLAPSPLRGGVGFVGAWTGEEWLLVEANRPEDPRPPSGSGAAYNPATDSWRMLPAAPLRPGWAAAAAWTGSTMVVIRFSGDAPSGGAQYDPESDQWTVVPGNPLLGLETYPFATPTDDGVLVTRAAIQTSSGIQAGPTAWLYDAIEQDWRAAAPPPRQLPYGLPVFTGELVIYYAPSGGNSWSYSPADDQWRQLAAADDRPREFWTTVWTGEDVLVWGGSNPAGPATTDGRALRLRE